MLRYDIGVSKNRGTPKWMVSIKMNDLGVPLFLETHMLLSDLSDLSIYTTCNDWAE